MKTWRLGRVYWRNSSACFRSIDRAVEIQFSAGFVCRLVVFVALKRENPASLLAPMSEIQKQVALAFTELDVVEEMLIASVIVPLIGINVAFLVLCASAIIDIWKNEWNLCD